MLDHDPVDGLAEVMPQMPPISHLNRVQERLRERLLMVKAPSRSRQMIWTPGWARSQSASVAASRSGSTSTGRWVVMF